MNRRLFMRSYSPYLEWIEGQGERMAGLVEEWASINSGSENVAGLERMAGEVKRAFAGLGGEVREIELGEREVLDERGEVVRKKLGKAVWVGKRRGRGRRVFLGIHMDTVFGAEHPFRLVRREGSRLVGPGVADAKGGLVVMLVALEALERSPWAEEIGWEVLINPDEEVGSPGSAGVLAECARRNEVGLVYEPSLPDGALVGERRGSGNFVAVVRGRAAHAGRDPGAGRNAIHALAELIVKVSEMKVEGITVNVGRVEGGVAVNVVPDLAMARFNLRSESMEAQERAVGRVREIVEEVRRREGIGVEVHGGFHAPPKKLNEGTLRLLETIAGCGRELGLELSWRASGGVSDGNKLAAAGLVTVDTLGVRGGELHCEREYVELDSLVERAKLSGLLLMKMGRGEGKR